MRALVVDTAGWYSPEPGSRAFTAAADARRQSARAPRSGSAVGTLELAEPLPREHPERSRLRADSREVGLPRASFETIPEGDRGTERWLRSCCQMGVDDQPSRSSLITMTRLRARFVEIVPNGKLVNVLRTA
jgi:hypothetical protein